MFSCDQLGDDVTVVLVTDGEGCAPSDAEKLREMRLKELQASMSLIAPRGWTLVRIKLPDAQVSKHENRLREILETVLTRDATLVAPFEEDGDSDHDAVGRACIAAARRLSLPLVRYPICAWHRLDMQAFRGKQFGRFHLTHKARVIKERAIACYLSQATSPLLRYFRRPYETYLL